MKDFRDFAIGIVCCVLTFNLVFADVYLAQLLHGINS